MEKTKVVNWILEVALSDGRVVKLDVDNDCAGAIDDFLTEVEESNNGFDDYIVKTISGGKKVKA